MKKIIINFQKWNLICLVLIVGIALGPSSDQTIASVSGNPNSAFNPYWWSFFGGTGSEVGFFGGPKGIATDNIHLYVVDSGYNRIQIFDMDGNYVDFFGGSGNTAGLFNNPKGIAVYGGNVFVADSGNDRIQVFDLAGGFVNQFGGFGNTTGLFDDPSGIALNDTHLFITDTNNNRVQIFDHSGNYLSSFGSLGIAHGELTGPIGIAVSNNMIFVGDAGNARVETYDLSGNFVYFGSVSDFATGSVNDILIYDGHILFTSETFILGFDIDGYNPDINGLGGIGHNMPYGMCGNDTVIYVTEFGDNTVNTFRKNFSPSALRAISGSNNINLMWNTPLDASSHPVSSYRIYRGLDVNNLVFYAETTDLFYHDFGISLNQTYFYFVTAVTIAGESYQSNIVSTASSTNEVTTVTVTETVQDSNTSDTIQTTTLFETTEIIQPTTITKSNESSYPMIYGILAVPLILFLNRLYRKKTMTI